MAIPSYNGATNIVSQLHDKPNTDDGLTASQLKSKFDKGLTDFVTWFNSTFKAAIQEKITISGSSILKGDGSGGIAGAVAGTDYQLPLTAGTDYQTPLTFDNTPTASSNNPVKSGGVYTALAGKAASDHNHSGVYEPVLGDEKKRRVYYGTSSAADYYTAQGLTAQTGDIYIKIPS